MLLMLQIQIGGMYPLIVKMINKNENKVIAMRSVVSALILVILSTFYVSALSIGSGGGVNIEPGTTVEDSFAIINTGDGAADLVVEVSIEEGSEFITLSGGARYDVSAGGVTAVPVAFSVPASANPGDVHPIKVRFRTVDGGGSVGGGSIEFKVGHTITFDINVVDEILTTVTPMEEAVEPEVLLETTGATRLNVVWWIVGIIVAIIIIWIIMRAMKKGDDQQVKVK
jgi:hypothetical protein